VDKELPPFEPMGSSAGNGEALSPVLGICSNIGGKKLLILGHREEQDGPCESKGSGAEVSLAWGIP
jgi:hypothetical protein